MTILTNAFGDIIQSLLTSIITSISLAFSIFLFFIEFVKNLFGLNIKPRDPQIILVTGASRGIGEALAYEYSRPGKTLILIARNQDKLNDVKKKCQRQGAKVETQSIDIQNHDELRQFIEDKFRQYGKIDLVIANAGITRSEFSESKNLKELEQEDQDVGIQEDFMTVIDTNVKGAITTVTSAFVQMKKKRQGQIAVVGSVAGSIGFPNYAVYNASKAALNSFTRDFRWMAKKHGVQVSLITPGIIETRMGNNIKKFGSIIPYVLMGDTQTLAKSIREGLEANWPIIGSYPLHQAFLTYALGALSPRITELLIDVAGAIKVGGEKYS